MLGALTPQPFRGDQVAAGVVVLTTLVVLAVLRLQEDVDAWGLFAVAAVACAFVSTLGWRSPTEPESPRGYQVALYVCSWLLALLALGLLADALGGGGGARTLFLIAAALVGVAAVWARGRGSSTLTLLGSLSGIVAVLAFVRWVSEPSDSTIRWVLLGCALVLAFAAVARRDHRPHHAAQLANAGALAVLAILGSEVAASAIDAIVPRSDDGSFSRESSLATGWELVGVGSGFGMVAYGAVDRHRGPVLVGVVLLAAWVVLVGGGDGGLLGWPLVLAVAAAFLLVVGLRPTTPAPPPPDAADAPASLRALPEREPEL